MLNNVSEHFNPALGGVSQDIKRLSDQSYIDLSKAESVLNLKHLSKTTKLKVEAIERQFPNAFACEAKKSGFLQGLYL